MQKPLHTLTATEIVHAVAQGKATCEAVTRACLDHISEREPTVQAWHFLDPELALAQARAADQRTDGALRGVPVGFKDIIDTADMPTEYGTSIHKGHRPRLDAACVALTRRAGGIAMGKTVTTEFANMTPGKARHPQDPTRTPGGSSSGSAAAVGDSMVPLAIGTQTTASTIRPAAFCGCVGYRPTWGDLRLPGVMEAAGSLDTLGLIARSIEDISLYRDVLVGRKPEPLGAPSAAKLRIGFCRTPMWERCDESSQKLLESCAQTLSKAGAQVSDVTVPKSFDGLSDMHRRISSFEFVKARAWEIDHHWEAISERLRKGRISYGQACTFEEYREARAWADERRREFDALMGDYDLLLTPSAAGEAPVGLESTGDASFCLIWTTLHVPALTLPLFKGPNGLPVGAQLIAARDADRKLFEAARWVERAAS